MARFGSREGIGRGEVAESRVEVPFFAVFMMFCAISLIASHVFFQNDSVTLALALSMLVFGATVVRVNMGVAILVVAMMLSPEVDLGTNVSGEHELNVRYDDLLIIVIFFGVLVKMAFEGRQMFWRPNPINAGIVAYFIVCIISTLLAVRANLPAWDRRLAFFVMLKMLEFYMVFFLVVNAMRDLRDVRRQLALFLAVAMIVCGYGMLMLRSVQRVGTPFEAQGPEPNTLGGYLVVVMCVAVGLLTQSPAGKKKLLFAAIAAAAFIPFLFTLSRASYIGLLVAMLTLGFVGRKAYVVLGVVLILVLSPFLMPADVKDRVNYTFQRGSGEEVVVAGKPLGFQVDKSTHERFYVWRKVWYLLHHAPWFGGGIAWETVLDSQYARVIMETGLIGLTAFLFLQWRIFRTCHEAYRWSRDWVGRGVALGATAAMAGLVTHSLGTISFLIIRIMEPFWFLVALTVIIRLQAMAEYARAVQQNPPIQSVPGPSRAAA